MVSEGVPRAEVDKLWISLPGNISFLIRAVSEPLLAKVELLHSPGNLSAAEPSELTFFLATGKKICVSEKRAYSHLYQVGQESTLAGPQEFPRDLIFKTN